jgi:hypothetical protein
MDSASDIRYYDEMYFAPSLYFHKYAYIFLFPSLAQTEIPSYHAF